MRLKKNIAFSWGFSASWRTWRFQRTWQWQCCWMRRKLVVKIMLWRPCNSFTPFQMNRALWCALEHGKGLLFVSSATKKITTAAFTFTSACPSLHKLPNKVFVWGNTTRYRMVFSKNLMIFQLLVGFHVYSPIWVSTKTPVFRGRLKDLVGHL